MDYNFYLRDQSSKNKTLIMFQCYFKMEGKKFRYSTGENINPKNWNYSTKSPFGSGVNKANDYVSINNQLNRYSVHFNKVVGNYSKTHEELTSQLLRSEFDKKFKRAKKGKDIFFDAFDKFVDINTKVTLWKPSTVKRYNNLKNILKRFKENRNYNLTFQSINEDFEAEFTDYCLNDLKHINNTFYRLMGFLRTFLYWSIEKGYTYNDKFTKFQKGTEVIVKHVVLDLNDLQKLMQHNFEGSKERLRDVFVFASVTGMRFGELKLINKANTDNDYISLKEEKDTAKSVRKIPLNEVSKYILKKYDYRLPLIANQKHNEGIKKVFKEAGYTHLTEKIVNRGNEIKRTEVSFHKRISMHSARRIFVTIMKRKGLPDKLIGEITGQTSKTINKYYQVEVKDTKKAVEQTFKFEYIPKLKKA